MYNKDATQSTMKKISNSVLSSLSFLILSAGAALSQTPSSVPNCSDVYQFYGAIHPRIGVATLYYISPTKNNLLRCFKGSRMGGASEMSQYIRESGITNEDKQIMTDAAKRLGFTTPYVHSLGI